MIWANLLHLSYNFWWDREVAINPASDYAPYHREKIAQPALRCDPALWQEVTGAMAEAGCTMVVIDLGDGIRYESCPEIAVDGAWSPGELREELRRLRELGLEPIPKLNFSTCHDVWLGDYGRMVTSPTYYRVVEALIRETLELFSQPRFLHLGMDEENAELQRGNALLVARQHELWWHDVLWMCELVLGAGCRPWVWADYAWDHRDAYLQRMPREVLQSNWHYDLNFAENPPAVETFRALDAGGFQQVPAGSNYFTLDNFVELVRWCREELSAERLAGFMQTPWVPTLPAFRDDHLQAIDRLHTAIHG